MKRSLLIFLLLISLFVTIYLITDIYKDCYVLFDKWYIVESLYKVRVIELLALLVSVTLSFRIMITLTKRELIKNISLSIYVISIIVFLGELIMMFVPVSQGDGVALSAKLWFGYYWRQNAYNFRDYDYDVKKLVRDSTGIIALIGDSFTEGHGVKHPEDRFSDLLRKKLPNETILNLGKNGFNTLQEMKMIASMPFNTKMIIMSHYSNDIDYLQSLIRQPQLKEDNSSNNKILESLVSYLNNSSFLYNYIYSEWKLLKQNFEFNINKYYEPSDSVKVVIEKGLKEKFNLTKIPSREEIMQNDSMMYFIQKHYSIMIKHNQFISPQESFLIDTILDKHIANYVTIKKACDSANVKFLVVLFPENGPYIDILGRNINDRMREALLKNNIEVIDLYPVIKDLPLKDRIVNKFDVHPDVKVHRRVADTLYNFLIRN
jgi:hypothetical protein